MKIKSVAVLGAGAVGSYVIWGLSEKKDIRLGVIASGERAKRLKNKGCKINDYGLSPGGMDTGRGTRRGFSDRLAQIRRTAGGS